MTVSAAPRIAGVPAPASPAEAAPAAGSAASARPQSRMRGRLFRKYVVLFMAVVSAALIASGGLEIWFAYQEQTAAMARIQREQAAGAASKIDQFIREVESQVGWTTQLPWTSGTLAQRQFDGQRLMRQVPAITELSQLDGTGRERLRISRLGMDEAPPNADLSKDDRFTVAMDKKIYYGPVYFRRDSEPYMTLAMSGSRRDAGVSIAEVNLKFIWDVVAQIKVGRGGQAYVIDADGRLVAHPDISRVLQNTDTAVLAQVRAARADATEVGDMIADDFLGREVISAFAAIPALEWFIFVELPVTEALVPLYAAIGRTGLLLLLGLGVALFSGLVLARRMLMPIKALQAGAAQVGAGDLKRRIDVRTGDELENLAAEFNDMAARLEESYAGLERKVAMRTRELELASQHKSQFLANMSHELRTPLNAILGYSELMLDNAYGEMPGEARDVLDRMESNGRHLLGLINDVLDLSKIEAGQLVLRLEDYAVPAMIGAVVAATESLARGKGLELRTRVAEGLPPGHGDERRLTQVLLNLVGNAIKFTDRGFVEIAAGANGKGFEIAVSDSGPGIAAQDQERIFGEFQQVDHSTTRKKGGTGLGLAISKRIVEMHGGTIAVESALGAGATFRVNLPLRAAPTAKVS